MKGNFIMNNLKADYVIVGFTLAEVLITLGVIGVVAAMTMPSVINHYQKQATVNKLKKFYTNMNQVMTLAKADNGDFSTWNYKNSKEFYNNYIKPYIKNVDEVQTSIHMHGDFASGIRFIFADGTQAIFSTTSNFAQAPVFIFYNFAKNFKDTNSDDIKKPTHERFYLIINDKGVIVPPNMNLTRNTNLTNCKNAFTSPNGYFGNNGHIDCATLIYKDGWKIEKDYPW